MRIYLELVSVLARVERRRDEFEALLDARLGDFGRHVRDAPQERARVVERDA